jgi:hypothetical protein
VLHPPLLLQPLGLPVPQLVQLILEMRDKKLKNDFKNAVREKTFETQRFTEATPLLFSDKSCRSSCFECFCGLIVWVVSPVVSNVLPVARNSFC